MKSIKFTQTISLTVIVEAEVPDVWDDSDIENFADNFEADITVQETKWIDEDDETTVMSLLLDSASVTETTVNNIKAKED